MISRCDMGLARQMLEISVTALEDYARQAPSNIYCLHHAASAAKLLGFADLLQRMLPLIDKARDPYFRKGRLRQSPFKTIPTWEELNKEYPPIHEALDVQSVRNTYTTTGLQGLARFCLDGNFALFQQTVKSDLEWEETVCTLAILRRFELAFRLLQHSGFPQGDPSHAGKPNRRRDVLLILCIELFQAGEDELFKSTFQEFEQTGIGSWEHIWLALGFGGREPWKGYPYPDW